MERAAPVGGVAFDREPQLLQERAPRLGDLVVRSLSVLRGVVAVLSAGSPSAPSCGVRDPRTIRTIDRSPCGSTTTVSPPSSTSRRAAASSTAPSRKVRRISPARPGACQPCHCSSRSGSRSHRHTTSAGADTVTSTLVGSSMPATVEDRSPLTTPRARQHRAVVGQYCARSTEVSECPGLPLSLCRLTSTAWYDATMPESTSKVAVPSAPTCPSGSILLVVGSSSQA